MDQNISRLIAVNSLKMGSIKLNPERPFLWASGYYMPIYNDNRMNLGKPEYKEMILFGMVSLMRELGTNPQVIAGTSTAGIPWASSLQDKLYKPMIYVRDKPKDHGLRNQIEGIDSDKDLAGKEVVLIEDLVSTGGSSVKAVSAIRSANGRVNNCITIFNYEFNEAQDMFAGKIPFDSAGNKLKSPCRLDSLLTYSILIQTALELGYVGKHERETLEDWRADPFNWGIKRGLNPVKK